VTEIAISRCLCEVHARLSRIEEELAEMGQMTAVERDAVCTTLVIRLAEWRDIVAALLAPLSEVFGDSIRKQHEDVVAAIDELSKRGRNTLSRSSARS
jgi:hypothetical protein